MLVRQQIRSVFRERLLILLTVLPVVLTVLPLLALPLIGDVLSVRTGFDLRPFFPVINAVLVMVTPFLLGLCFAFLLIDDRDRGIFETIEVTPSGLERYLAARISFPFTLSFVYSVLLLPFFFTGPWHVRQLIWSAIISALECALWALMILAFSRNKVGAMAVGKGMTLLAMLPLASLYIPHPGGLVFAVLPTYWLFHTVVDPVFSAGLRPLPGVALHIVLIVVLWRRIVGGRRT